MITIRTTKEVQTSLHTEETHKLEFKFTYSRHENGMTVRVIPYMIDVVDEVEELNLVHGAETHRDLSNAEIEALSSAAVAITPTNDSPVVYFDSVIASGIKIAITTEGLWKNILTMSDFE